MSRRNRQIGAASTMDGPSSDFQDPRGSLHRISETRKLQGVSLRTAARRMHTSVADARAEENNADLRLSALYRWCQALEVPIEELLIEPSERFTTPVLSSVQLLRMMKTSLTIREAARSKAIRHLAQMLVDQLGEIQPELKKLCTRSLVPATPLKKRFGRIVETTYSDSWLGAES